MSAPLQLEGIIVRRSRQTVLDGVALSVRPGEVVGVVGPNGAGKTTLMRAALGLQPLAGGEVLIGGSDPARLPPMELARRVGYLPQERRLAWNLPAWRVAALGALHQPPAMAISRAMAGG